MSQDPFASLREKLENETSWPSVYLFKFIIPADNEKLAKVEALFGNEAQVTINQSRNGKYLSISAKELMLSVDSVMERYKKANAIPGLMAL